MTDEDTDDDNDRMNRADRLREMREGRRRGRGGNDDGGDETSESDASDDTDTDDDAGRDVPLAGDADETSSEDTSADADGNDGDAGRDVPLAGSAGGSQSDDADTDDDTTDDAGVEESGFEFDESEGETEPADHAAKAEKTDIDEAAQTGASAEEASTDPQSGIAQTVSAGDAASAVERLNSGNTFAIPEQATTVTEADEQSTLEGAEQSVAAARAAASRGTTHVGSRTRVLEFELGNERFCLDIDYIEEIVELENMTRVPNSPSYVEGVVDLRGQVTTIINPKDALDVEQTGKGELIIVFDSEEVGDQGHLGWVVDEVRQVTPVSDDEVNESPDEDAEHINGIINREDEDDFVVWTTPELALNSS